MDVKTEKQTDKHMVQTPYLTENLKQWYNEDIFCESCIRIRHKPHFKLPWQKTLTLAWWLVNRWTNRRAEGQNPLLISNVHQW